jgi:hypothetical protein
VPVSAGVLSRANFMVKTTAVVKIISSEKVEKKSKSGESYYVN